MGMFTNPLSHAGYPPGVTGTPSTQPSEVRAATAAEAVAGVLNNVYISPATMAGSGGELGPRTAHGVIIGEGTTLPLGATAAGSANQVLQSGGASADPVWSTATYPSTVTAGSLLHASATNTVTGLADVATGSVLVSGGVGAAPSYSATPTITSLTVSAPSVAGASPVVNNAKAGQASFTDTVGFDNYATLVNTNSSITASSVIVASASCATVNSAVYIVGITPGSGTVSYELFNAGSADTTGANVLINYSVLN